MNSAFSQEEAAKLADRLQKEAPDDPTAQIKLAWRLITSRDPSGPEIKKSLLLMRSLRNDDPVSETIALNNFCLMMLNLNEFVYVN